MSDSQGAFSLQPTRVLCPWDFSGKNTAIGGHFLRPEDFSWPRDQTCLLWILYLLSHQGSLHQLEIISTIIEYMFKEYFFKDILFIFLKGFYFNPEIFISCRRAKLIEFCSIVQGSISCFTIQHLQLNFFLCNLLFDH